MDYQLAIVIFLFLLAVLYMGRMLYKSLNSNKSCASNCGKCSADFSEVKSLDSVKK